MASAPIIPTTSPIICKSFGVSDMYRALRIVATIGCTDIRPPIGPEYPIVIALATMMLADIYMKDAIPPLIHISAPSPLPGITKMEMMIRIPFSMNCEAILKSIAL